MLELSLPKRKATNWICEHPLKFFKDKLKIINSGTNMRPPPPPSPLTFVCFFLVKSFNIFICITQICWKPWCQIFCCVRLSAEIPLPEWNRCHCPPSQSNWMTAYHSTLHHLWYNDLYGLCFFLPSFSPSVASWTQMLINL